MSTLQLSLAYADNPRSRALLNGKVVPDGLDLICTRAGMSDLAWRQLAYKEFEASELSISSLLISRSRGEDTWVGLPIFSSRRFFHSLILVSENAGIDTPADLVGKRMGVPEYQQTAALWNRGILQHEFGVDPTSMTWFMERLPERSHGGATGFHPPEGIDLTYIPAEKSIASMLRSGELDASLFYIGVPNLVDRSEDLFGPGSGVRLLFPDQRAESTRYISKTGIIPLNHMAVVRKDVVDRNPWVVRNLYDALLASRDLAAYESRREFEALVEPVPLEHKNAQAFRADPFPYGIEANREALETAFAYSAEQGLTPRKMSFEEIFHSSVLGT